MDVSRRQFAGLAAAGFAGTQATGAQAAAAQAAAAQAAAARSGALSGKFTARQVIEQIQKNIGVAWKQETVDTFKAGDPDTAVRGIATTVMSTLDVLQRSAKAGLNLIITHEPTFYNHADETESLAGDPVFQHKREFIAKNKQVIWRFHDHWHARKPDAVSVGLAAAMGWADHQGGEGERSYVLPSTTLGALAKDIQSRMKIRTMRVVGDPNTKVSKAAISPGYSGFSTTLRRLPQADVIVLGEIREWEGVEYAHDTVAAGFSKGMILLGHAVSEDPGMSECAAWLKTFVSDVPVEFVPAGEPFWNPATV
jgi:putative NIF3 family GTP cyclohydrolase 1 type 2